MGGTCDQCHLFSDSIHYTNDYGEICNDCREYINEETEGEDYVPVEIDSDLVEKLVTLIRDDQKRREETKDLPVWHNGIRYSNIEEYEKCQQC